MFVYRIVKSKKRATDLSGTGAYKTGGRWNSKGTYMLYTSENSSLAYLETLVHFDETDYPPDLFIIKLEVNTKAPIYTLPDKEYPQDWMQLGLLQNKIIGDQLMAEKKYAGIKVRSAINAFEFNYLLNPLFPRFYDLIKIVEIDEIKLDERLVN
jgi:RES domain-containing protein